MGSGQWVMGNGCVLHTQAAGYSKPYSHHVLPACTFTIRNRSSGILVSDILILVLGPELLHEVLTRSPVGQPTYSMNACNLELRLKLRASMRR